MAYEGTTSSDAMPNLDMSGKKEFGSVDFKSAVETIEQVSNETVEIQVFLQMGNLEGECLLLPVSHSG